MAARFAPARQRPALGQFHASFAGVGTVIDVVGRGEANPGLAESLVRHAGALERRCSRFLPNSEISALNTAARSDGGWVRVSHETAELLRAALSWAERTDGAFTPVIGALMELWDVRTWLTRLSAEGESPPWPNEAHIAAARARCRPELLEEGRANRFRLRRAAQIDLGGVAKGALADQLREVARAGGLTDVLVSVGTSSLAAAGARSRGVPWRAGVRAVDQGRRAIVGSFDLVGTSLATSGDYLQRLPDLIEGRAVHHVIDPRTGEPSTSGVRSATVVASDGITAEVAATTLMVTGQLDRSIFQGCEWVWIGNDGELTSHAGSAWHPVAAQH
ncbi:MAG: FAD:protein FMN transferase [Bowdeniella nasicola]|nr:FAD:protein FMN transferase [Bowdeniella nasicola]